MMGKLQHNSKSSISLVASEKQKMSHTAVPVSDESMGAPEAAEQLCNTSTANR